MSTQKAKFQLFAKLQELGFTYEESVSLRRIEMTLQRWAEAECGDSNEYASFSIERDETTGKPFHCVYPHQGQMRKHPIADREAGALRRLKAIVGDRNSRQGGCRGKASGNDLIPYHQGDCRGCALLLVKRSDIPALSREDWLRNNPTDKSEAAYESAKARQIDSYYTRGLAVCC